MEADKEHGASAPGSFALDAGEEVTDRITDIGHIFGQVWQVLICCNYNYSLIHHKKNCGSREGTSLVESRGKASGILSFYLLPLSFYLLPLARFSQQADALFASAQRA
ncbi:hypothetical protein [Candidatus Magnetaquicoccus inordinatus]|uniref:hypothetical protein n=1 Tax=Candidatus Magnetaquicoccus inordinatus TaxID=2496818 RepID=UPI00187D1481|nr:hypothetical protein [Candidatus Magnetaquicoccus inordinatus]